MMKSPWKRSGIEDWAIRNVLELEEFRPPHDVDRNISFYTWMASTEVFGIEYRPNEKGLIQWGNQALHFRF